MNNSPANSNKRICLLISGRGSNMQAIHQRCLDGSIGAVVAAVISNNPEAGGLEYAAANGIAHAVIDHNEFSNSQAFEQALARTIDQHSPDLLALAGFMRVLSGTFTDHYDGRLVNIHPSLLPRHKGLHTHQKALANGDRWHGCSVHFVSPALDGGPLIARSVVPVLADDTEQSLASRVLKKEHVLYPLVIAKYLRGEIACGDSKVLWQGSALRYPLTI